MVPPTLIEVGVLRLLYVPSPSWPVPPLPQHFNVPAVRYAHVWEIPRARSPTVPPTLIVVGVLRFSFVPSPSWP